MSSKAYIPQCYAASKQSAGCRGEGGYFRGFVEIARGVILATGIQKNARFVFGVGILSLRSAS